MVLITGATGFVGRHVVDKFLSDGQELVLIVRDRNKYIMHSNEIVIEGNLGSIDDLANKLGQFKIDACVHLAWEGIPDYSFEMSRKNLDYGMNVLELCRILNIRHLVITGSCWEYESPVGCISTDDRLSDANSFKAAKNALHMLAHSFCRENCINLNWIRLFYVYGPGQREGSLIPHIIKCFREGRQPELNGAFNKNDFVYVGDVADAIVKVTGEEKYPEVLNCGSGKSVEVLEIVRLIARMMGRELHEAAYERSGSEVDFYADSKEMLHDYQWTHEVGTEEGIWRMICATG